MSDPRPPQSSTDIPDIPQTLDVPLPAPSTATLPTQVAGRVSPTADSAVGMPSVPGFTIVRELGRGGMGVVYQGRHIALSRDVALKMILGGDHASASERSRFRSEAEAVARLQHPGIVQIYEIGESDGRPFFALEFCSGGSLAAVINGTPLEPLKAARFGEALAQAMAAAHEHGIMHRDLKPANVLLDAAGAPKIADFGLAKKIGESGDTASGAVLGTPSYMAPEQAMGRIRELGPAADIYSLGAILYEMLTGRPPFRGSTAFETLEQVVLHEPVPLSQLNAKAPLDLETICLKCLRKEAGRRYRSAGELADDLRRFQNGEPIHARPVGATERLWRWTQRNPALAGISAALLLSLVAGTLIAWYFALQADERADEAIGHQNLAVKRAQEANDNLERFRVEKDRADGESERAKRAALNARRLLYVSRVRLAQRAWHNADGAAVQALLEDQQEFADFEWHYLQRLCRGELLMLYHKRNAIDLGHSKSPTGLDLTFSPNGRQLTTASVLAFFGPGDDQAKAAGGFGNAVSSPVRTWDTRSGKVKDSINLTLSSFQRDHALALSPNGRRLVVTQPSQVRPPGFLLPNASDDAHANIDRAWVFDAGTGQKLLELPHGPGLMCVAFNRDGERLATAGGIWDAASSSYTGGVVKLWSLQQGARAEQTPVVLSGHEDRVGSLSMSRRNNRLASGDLSGVTKIWNVATGKEVGSIAHNSATGALALSPDGELVARCARGRIIVWSVNDGAEQASLATSAASRTCPVFSPDGQRLAVLDGNTVRLWDAFTGDEVLTIRGLPGPAERLAFSPDGRQLAVCGHNLLQLWDVTAHPEYLQLPANAHLPGALLFSPDGRRFAAGDESTLRVWDARTGRELLTLAGQDNGAVTEASWSDDGKHLCGLVRPHNVEDPHGAVKVWDDTGKELWARKTTSVCARLSPDGKAVALGGAPDSAAVTTIENGQERFRLHGHAHPIVAVVFSDDGALLASAAPHPQAGFPGLDGAGGEVRVWDARTGELRHRHAFSADGLRFSPDGRRLAGVSGGFVGRTVKVWNTADGQELLSIDWPTESIHGVAFSSDGRYLATGGVQKAGASLFPVPAPHGEDRAVQVWDLERAGAEPLLRLPGHRDGVSSVAFSHDGKRLVSSARDGTVRVWDAVSGEELLRFDDWQASRVQFARGNRVFAVGTRLWIAETETPRNRAERLAVQEQKAFAWHCTEAEHARDNERTSALRFHVQQLAILRPSNPAEFLRRGRLASEAQSWTLALADYTAYLEKEKATPEVLALRGHASAALSKWEDADKDYAKAVAGHPTEEWIWSEHATLRLRAGDLAGYRQACRELYARFIKADDLETISNVAWTCSRGPGALLDQQYTRLTKRLEELSAAAENHDYDGTLGALCYRAGKLPKALKHLRAVVAGENGGVADSLFLALTEHASKQTTTAKATLTKARKLLSESKADGWREREERQLLRAEAEALVQGGK